MLQDSKTSSGKDVNDQQLKSEVEYRKNLQEICNKIYAASNLDEILVDLKDEITGLFEAERLTVYVVGGNLFAESIGPTCLTTAAPTVWTPGGHCRNFSGPVRQK